MQGTDNSTLIQNILSHWGKIFEYQGKCSQYCNFTQVLIRVKGICTLKEFFARLFFSIKNIHLKFAKFQNAIAALILILIENGFQN